MRDYQRKSRRVIKIPKWLLTVAHFENASRRFDIEVHECRSVHEDNRLEDPARNENSAADLIELYANR